MPLNSHRCTTMITEPRATLNSDSEQIAFESDDAIITRVLGGETECYALILRRYNQRLFRIARSILQDDALAEDALQEAYVAAYKRLPQYQARGAFSSWLTRITINEARMSRRKQSRYRETDIIEDQATNLIDQQATSNPAQRTANGELATLIESAMSRLPESFRLVFMLRGVQQLSIDETAFCLGIPPATVKTRYHRARILMQQSLTPHIVGAGLQLYEFAGKRCDNLVSAVMRRLEIPYAADSSTAALSGSG